MTIPAASPTADPQPPPRVLFYPGKNMWAVEYFVLGQRAEKLFSNDEQLPVVREKIATFLDQLKSRQEAVA